MNEITEIIKTIQALRDKDTGCPWDREQTLSTLIKPLQEETEELIEALEDKDREHIAEELGDVIWNALILLETAEEEGIAKKSQILSNVNNKMICRHPHVFDGIVANSTKEAIQIYSEAKAKHNKCRQNAE